MTTTRRRLLDDTFKKTVEGNPAIAIDSLARMYPGIVMQGWTEQAKTTGAQLFDQSLAEDNKYQNFDINSNDFSVVQNNEFWITGKIPVKPNTTYTINANAFGAYYSDVDTPITTTIKEENPFTTPENANYVCLNLKKSNYQFGSDIMLNEGSTVLPWEPYTGGQPSPSPDYPQEIVSAGTQNQDTGKWEYEVEVLGGNLWSKDQNAEFIASKNFSFNTPIPEGEYIFSSIVHSTDTDANQNLISINMENGKTLYYNIDRSEDNERVDVAVKITSPCVSIQLYASTNYGISAGDTALFSDIMINLGNTALPYEPYKTPQTVTLTADRPLTKWDRLEKRNGQWGWVYKSAEIESYTNESVPGEYYSTTGQLSAGAQVWHEIDTETFAPLTTAEQEAMNALHTYRPTTVLSNQQGCQMALTYKTRKGVGG